MARCEVYPTLAVDRVEDSCNWYAEKLGFEVRFLWGTPVTHGAVMLDKACLHFWQGPVQHSQNWLYFDVDNLEQMYLLARENGVTITRAPETYPWGMREFNAIDLNGYHIRFGQHVDA